MPFIVLVSDATGTILSTREGDESERDALISAALDEVSAHIINRVVNSLPDNVKSPLTVKWGDSDA